MSCLYFPPRFSNLCLRLLSLGMAGKLFALDAISKLLMAGLPGIHSLFLILQFHLAAKADIKKY
jgi:hypothetical protein